ncbi:2-oxoglutarate dehydrogenase, E2 component, dihydrolipoamide succinyltransferase [Micrococcus luteus]|uniref:2-oxoglutarate dehydrogenase, E2 component, dihydrolipoamide succinyltransferase n=1 Tax=Micrococcus luteus TaxID=1270 RepID=UPI0011AB30F9|nr:2-oxoglutarate dehydrogenase, E2 component, dihydrolipoamide succinyltransferase [Micrococcus luteus]
MSETVNLPALGESVTEGTVTRWLKAVGDEVAVDEPLVEVSTDKVDTEIPSPVAGVLEEILVEEDDTVEVGAPLATIGDGSGGGSADASEDDAAAEEPAVEEAQQDDAQQEPAGEPAPEERASTDQGSDGAPSAGGEASEVTLPALGESVTEGTVTRWLKSVGDEVEVDEPLLEVSTDKVDTEIPSPVAGTLLEIRAEEDDTVEVGAVLALVGSGSAGGGSAPSEGSSGQDEASAEEIEDKATEAEAPEETEEAAEAAGAAGAEKSEETPEASPSEEASRRESAERDSAQGESAEAPAATEPGQGYVTPLVRRLAHQNNVDLSTVRGTGVGGRIRKQDVLAAALASQAAAGGSEAPAEQASEAAAPSSAASAPATSSSVDPSVRGEVEKAPRIRQVIAQRMRESLDLSAQLTQVHEVDVTRIVQLRKKAKASFQQQAGVNLTYLPFITKAVAEALKQHPKLNASFSEDNKEITYHASEDIAIAVDTEKGLLVPVIKDAGSLNLTGLAQKIADVAERTRTNKISPDELSGGTFSITNIGSVGALFDTPIINQPQVAILGIGAIVKRPMVVTDTDGNDSIAIRHMMYLSLTYDHRLVDGADAGRFLTTLRQRLEGGEFANELGL